MEIFIVEVHQGQWDSHHTWIAKAFYNTEDAVYYSQKLKQVFQNCYNFYYDKWKQFDNYFESITDESQREEEAVEWCRIHNLVEYFNPPTCVIKQIEIR